MPICRVSSVSDTNWSIAISQIEFYLPNRLFYAFLARVDTDSPKKHELSLTLCLPLTPFGKQNSLWCSFFTGATDRRIDELLDLFSDSLPCSNWFICEISDVV